MIHQTEPEAKRPRIGEGHDTAEQAPVSDSQLTANGNAVDAIQYLQSHGLLGAAPAIDGFRRT
jgi:hypothetical protein